MAQHERLPFDPKSVSIDGEATANFYERKIRESKERGSNPIRIGKDRSGNTLLLKTSIFFKRPDQPNDTADLSRENLENNAFLPSAEDMYDHITERLHDEVQAAQLGRYLGASMLPAEMVEVDGVSFVASPYLEESEDVGYANTFDMHENPAQRQQQSKALAFGALMKMWLRATDDGQYLETGSGELFLIDIGLRETAEFESPEEARDYYVTCFVRNNTDVLSHQVAGFLLDEMKEALQKIESISEIQLRKLVCKDAKNPTNSELREIEILLERRESLLAFAYAVREEPQRAVAFIGR